MTINRKYKETDWTHLPKTLDIDEILSRNKSPECMLVSENKLGAMEYTIYQYVNLGRKLTEISDEIEASSYIVPLYWLKKYGVYEKDTIERKKQGDIRFKRTLKFRRQCKELFDSGIKTYAAIARKMKCNETTVTIVAKEDGWDPELNRRKFVWKVPKEMPENNILEYKNYKLMIHYFSKKIMKKHFSLLYRLRLMYKEYNIDHILSVYDAFYRGDKPIPWQWIIHPANLQIITREANLIKGRHSLISPIELHEKINKYEEINRKVELPIEVPKIPKYSNRWNKKKS
jgi:hypothetical protein